MVSAAYLAFAAFLLQMPNWLQEFHSGEIAMDSLLSSAKPSYILNTTEEFDFIIVGGGSAGLLIGNRLSANGRSKVLVLERGGSPPYPTSIPDLWYSLVLDDGPNGIVKRYNTTFQPGFSMLTGGINGMIGPKVLGGGSTLNNVLFIRGSHDFHDEWAESVDDAAWSAESVLPYFKMHEDYHGAYLPVDKDVHGVGGEISIEEAYQTNPSSVTFFKALKELGISEHDLSGPQQGTGYQRSDLNVNRGRRASTYQAFIVPVQSQRPNLSVYKFSTATKILLDDSNKAYGVVYTRHGQNRVAKARKEVIVSAGAFESPRLLMLSGIGVKSDLAEFGIESVADLPVGKNFNDHVMATLQVNFNQPQNAFVPGRDFNEETVADYFVDGKGPLKGFTSTMGYTSSSLNNNPNYPDIQVFVSYQPVIIGPPDTNETGPDLNLISLYVNRPLSAPGFLKLQSTDPSFPLFIDPNYFDNPGDVQIMQEGFEQILKIYEETNAYAEVGGAKLDESKFPAFCTNLGRRTPAFWNCLLRLIASAGHHFVGTNKMGKGLEDPTAVVDPKLRVLKTKNLRVADASVIPKVPNANTLATTLMVAEKAADYITRHWRLAEPSDAICDGRTGVDGLFPDPLSCTNYYQCHNQKRIQRSCPLLTHFNADTGKCDWPHSANCVLSALD